MKKYNYLFISLFIFLFMPRVHAFSYDVTTDVFDTSVEVGSLSEIRVSLENVKGTNDGISACSLEIEFDSNIALDSKVRVLNGWNLTTGNFYLFDTGIPVMNNSELFIIPVQINGNGKVKLVDIKCSDGNSIVEISDRIVEFDIDNIANEENMNDAEIRKDSNCDLSNIKLSEGSIEFDSNITEYELKVTSFMDLVIEPILSSDKASFLMEKTDDMKVLIDVSAEDGTNKVYTIYVKEVPSMKVNNESAKYAPILIVVFCLLVLFNIVKFIKSRRK